MDPEQPILLDAVEARVLGSLVEKEISTPDYYPLSLNALMNACNQRSNREPVMNLSEDDVRQGLVGLQDQRLAGPARDADSRVTKYEHRLGEAFNFSRAEAALLCVLLLRGAQTPGELRGRTERMHRFDELSDVLAGLKKLMDRQPPIVAVMPRQPGTKEARFAHLLSGGFEPGSVPPVAEVTDAADPVRLSQIETELAELRREVDILRERLDVLVGK